MHMKRGWTSPAIKKVQIKPRQCHLGHRHGQRLHNQNSKSNCNKSQNWQMGANNTKELCTAKKYQQNEQATYRMGGKFCNLLIWQRVNIQNLQRTQTNLQEKSKQPHQKVGKGYEQTLLKRRYLYSKKNMKKSSSSLVIREMRIKTTMRYHITPVRMAIIKSQETTDAREDVEK